MKKRKKGRGCLIAIILVAVIAYGLIHTNGEIVTSAKNFIQNNILTLFEKPAITLGSEIKSEHAELMDLSTGKVICKKNSDQKTFPASLTKIMTTILAIENIPDINEKVTVPESIYKELKSEDASMAGFLPGEKVSAVDLLYGTILPSGADAAESLAFRVSGSDDKFVELMNKKAKDLGMNSTHFTNVTGLHNDNHYTTASDFAKLLKYSLQNDTFKKVFTTVKYTTGKTDKHPKGITFGSTMFGSLTNPDFNGGKIIGGKTGYTDKAGLCLASLAEKNGKYYILITTGASGDHESEQFNITDALYVYNNYLP